MKKGIVAVLLILAFVVILSPALVGKLAEKSVDENLNWAANESGELKVTSQGFDRGWFSSEGQHRIELGDGNIRAAMTAAAGADGGGDIPVLLIDTHMDHGLIPVSSMSREKGSLAPGLGSAVSKMSIQYGGGESFDVPGTIYSKVGLGGDVQSNYVLEAGSQDTDDGTIAWEPSNIEFAADPGSGSVAFDGAIGKLSIDGGHDKVALDSISFSGEQQQTEYGFAVGDVQIELGNLSVSNQDMPDSGLKGMSLVANSTVDDGVVSGESLLKMESKDIPGFGAFSLTADLSFSDTDAVALGKLTQRLKSMQGSTDPSQVLFEAEQDFAGLFAAGINFNIRQFDVVLPMGTVESVMNFSVPESDAASFNWTSLLLSLAADIDIKVPEALVDLATQMNPQAGMIVGMGYLQKNGDRYEMNAIYKKGVLTINGAPIPIPLGALQ